MQGSFYGRMTGFDEWISASGALSEPPSGWLSLIVNPPIWNGVAG